MKILLSPCGIGLGHIGRLAPIGNMLRKNGEDILFSTYGEAVKYAESESFRTVRVPPIDIKVKEDGSIDLRWNLANPGPFILLFTFLKQIKSELRIIQKYKPDLIISDSRAAPILAAKLLDVPSLCILNQFGIMVPRRRRLLRLARLTDYGSLTILGRVWTLSNKVLIPDFPKPYTLSEGNLHIPKLYRRKVKFIGPILPTYPNDLPTTEKLRRKMSVQPKQKLIFAPISGPVKEKAYLIRILKDLFSRFPAKYKIIMSTGNPHYRKRIYKKGNLAIYGWIDNRFDYLKACDVVVARSGHETIMQSICYGKPTILIPTPSHTEQLVNAKKARDLGFSVVLEQDKITLDTLLESVEYALSDKIRRRAEEFSLQTSEYDGVKIVLSEIYSTLAE